MIRRLFIVSASALVLAIVCLAGAWAIGGREMIANGGWTLDSDGIESGPHEKRTLAFDPAQPLVIEAPVNLEFKRGDTVSMTLTGGSRLIQAMRWEKGRLFLSGERKFGGGTLNVEITAPVMPSLVLRGPGNIEIRDISQPSLAIEMAGAGNIDATGKVDTLKVDASGAGNVDLSSLDARDADINLAGFGNADINASGKVNAAIAGAGNITLHRKPAELHSEIAGLGNVSHDY